MSWQTSAYPPRVPATSHMDFSASRGRLPGAGWSSSNEQTSPYGCGSSSGASSSPSGSFSSSSSSSSSGSWPSSPRQGASQYGYPRGDFPDYVRESRGGWRSSSEADFTPRFSGMTMGDVMRVTVMKEMEKLNMTRHRPLDLSRKSNSDNKKGYFFK